MLVKNMPMLKDIKSAEVKFNNSTSNPKMCMIKRQNSDLWAKKRRLQHSINIESALYNAKSSSNFKSFKKKVFDPAGLVDVKQRKTVNMDFRSSKL